MRSLRLVLVGAIISALIGSSSSGATFSMDSEEWLSFDRDWPEWNRQFKQAADAIARNDQAQTAVKARLKTLAGDRWPTGWYWRFYRLMWTEAWHGKFGEAERELVALQQDRESLEDEQTKVRYEMVAIETDEQRRLAALERMAALDSVGTEYPKDYGVDPSTFRWGTDVGYKVGCAAMSRDEGREDVEIGRKVIGAGSLEEIAEVIAGPLEGCVPNEWYNAKLIIEAVTKPGIAHIAWYEGTLRKYPGG